MTKSDILEIAESYKTELHLTISNAEVDENVKDLVNEIGRQTFYAIYDLCKAVADDH